MRKPFRRMMCTILAAFLLLSALPAPAEGTDIKALQERLIALGFEIGKADGIAGKKTTSAIQLAQTILAEAGLDGTVTEDFKRLIAGPGAVRATLKKMLTD